MLECTSTVSIFTYQMDSMRTNLYFNNFKGAISEQKEVLPGKGHDYEDFVDEIMESSLSEPFFTRRMKMLSRPDSFMLYDELGVDFFSISVSLYPDKKNRLRLVRA